MTIWCTCGLTQRIDCAHKWVLDKTDSVSFEKMGGEIHQTLQIRICKICGAIANMNTTAGTTVIRH